MDSLSTCHCKAEKIVQREYVITEKDQSPLNPEKNDCCGSFHYMFGIQYT